MELQWLAFQRSKRGEISAMMMAGNDKKESDRQHKAEKRKAAEEEAKQKRNKKQEEQEKLLQEKQDEFHTNWEVEQEEEFDQELTQQPGSDYVGIMKQKEEVRKLVDTLLEERLGDEASLVLRYLERPAPRNTMPVPHTARASIRSCCFYFFIILNLIFHTMECLLYKQLQFPVAS